MLSNALLRALGAHYTVFEAVLRLTRRYDETGIGERRKGKLWGFIISTWIQINRDASTRVLLCVLIGKATLRHRHTGSNTSATPSTQHKEGSRSLSSLHCRDRPRARLCRHRWRRCACALLNSISLVVHPKLSPTVTASTFEILCTSYCEVHESRCRCQRHRTMVSLGYRTETLEPINMGSTKHNDATDARTSWTRRSLSRNLLEHVDVALTFCAHQVYQGRSYQASGIHTAGI